MHFYVIVIIHVTTKSLVVYLLKFEVIGPDGVCKMSTKYVSCVPDADTLKSMTDAGYTFRLNNRRIKLSAIHTEVAKQPVTYRILCIETEEVFDTQSQAAKHLGIDPAAVSDSIKTGKVRAGYTFKKIEVLK